MTNSKNLSNNVFQNLNKRRNSYIQAC